MYKLIHDPNKEVAGRQFYLYRGMKLNKEAIHEYQYTKYFSFNSFSCSSQHEGVATFFATDGAQPNQVPTLMKIQVDANNSILYQSQFISTQKISRHDE